MEGHSSDKRIALVFDVIDWAALAGALFLAVTRTGFDFKAIAIMGLALAAVIYYVAFFKGSLKNSRYALTILLVINTLLLFYIADATGSLSGIRFPIFFALFMILGVYLNYFSFIIPLIAFGFVLLPVLHGGSPSLLISASVIELSAFAILFPFSVFFGRQLAAVNEDKKRASFLAEHMNEEKSRDEAVLASIGDAVYAVDEERRIILWNKSAEDLTGLKTQEVLGLRDLDLLDLRDAKGKQICPGPTCPIDEAWASNRPVRRDDIFMLVKNHRTIALSYNAAPIKDVKNRVSGAVVIFQDITRRKEVERMRNEFVSVASHEMRTPIAAVEGYISLAQKIGEGKMEAKAAEYLNKAHGSVVSAANLLKNLLLVSKIDEDALPVEPTTFDLNDVLESAVTTLMPVAQAKGLTLSIDRGKAVAGEGEAVTESAKTVVAEPAKIYADEERIREVIQNLIDNGIKFTKQGGITCSITSDKNFVTLCVQDTGAGIPAAEIPKLFRKFYRVDNTFTREVGGTGLGLYLARSIIEKSGGKIWAESEQGKGAKFCFTLPRVA